MEVLEALALELWWIFGGVLTWKMGNSTAGISGNVLLILTFLTEHVGKASKFEIIGDSLGDPACFFFAVFEAAKFWCHSAGHRDAGGDRGGWTS